MDRSRLTLPSFFVHSSDYMQGRSNMDVAIGIFLLEKVLGVLEIEEEGEPN